MIVSAVGAGDVVALAEDCGSVLVLTISFGPLILSPTGSGTSPLFGTGDAVTIAAVVTSLSRGSKMISAASKMIAKATKMLPKITVGFMQESSSFLEWRPVHIAKCAP